MTLEYNSLCLFPVVSQLLSWKAAARTLLIWIWRISHPHLCLYLPADSPEWDAEEETDSFLEYGHIYI